MVLEMNPFFVSLFVVVNKDKVKIKTEKVKYSKTILKFKECFVDKRLVYRFLLWL